MITIRSYDTGSVRAVVQPNNEVSQTKEILALNFVELSFSLPLPVTFRIGDFASINGETYYLTTRPVRTKSGLRNYTYTLNMEGEQHKLGRTQYQKPNEIGLFLDSTFFINATADVFMQLMLENMQRTFPDDGWKLGFVVDNGVKNISFDGANCLEAIGIIAEAFDTEWLVEGRTIHLYRKQNATGLVLRQGEDEALISITERQQDNSNVVTRLYAYGSTRNLPLNYRNGATKLRMGDSTYVDRNVEQYGLWEASITFDDVFPRRIGEVTDVDAGNPLVFSDADIPFNVNDHLVDGATAKVSFETGQLAGYEFEIESFNNGTKTFTLKKKTDETALDVPGDAIRPGVGDRYFVFDIRMPNVDVLDAESELRQRALEWMDENSANAVAFGGECNPLFFKRNGRVIRLADVVTLEDAGMGINVQLRVVKLTRNVRDPNLYTIELARKAKPNPLVKLLSSI